MIKIKKLFLGFFFTLLILSIMLSLSSLCILKIGLPTGSAAGMIDMFCVGLAVSIGSFLTARWAGESGLIHGITLSAIISVLYIVLGAALNFSFELNVAIIRVVAFVACGALGGMLGVNRTQHIRF